MNVHEDKKAALSALLDGELSDAERAEVLAHLDACEECRVYYAELCALHDAMGDLDEVEVPENFAAGVLARLHEDAAPKKKPAGMWRKWGALAACAAVVVLAAAVLPNALNSKNTQEASVAAPKAAIAPESAENTQITTSLMAEPAVGSVASPDEGTEAAAEEESAVNGVMTATQSADGVPYAADRKAERREADLLLYGADAAFWLWNNCEYDEEQDGYWVYRGTLAELPDGLTLGTAEMVERWNRSGRDFAFVRAADAEGAQ